MSKMRAFSFYPNGEDALAFVPSDLDYFEKHFVGKRMASDWKAPAFGIQRSSRPVRDFVSWFLGAMVVTAKAKSAIEKLIAPYVEFLPLAVVKGHELFAVNVIEILDCLDREASNVTYSPDDPTRVIHIGKVVFIPRRLKRVPIFKVPEWPGSVFVSEEFVHVVVEAKLKGAGFDDPENIRYVKTPWDGTMSGLPAVRGYQL